MRMSSFAPDAPSSFASFASSSSGRDRKRPRIPGIEQKVHGLSQPSAIRRYA